MEIRKGWCIRWCIRWCTKKKGSGVPAWMYSTLSSLPVIPIIGFTRPTWKRKERGKGRGGEYA